jgi:hypothetical protein
MRHSKIDLTMNCYTDPRLLDVAGALDLLPELSLNRPTSQKSDTALVTGTDDQNGGVQLAPWLATNSVPMCISGAKPVTLGKMTESPAGESDRAENVENPTKKGSFSNFENEPLKRPRRDLNSQPPDRQSGALTN